MQKQRIAPLPKWVPEEVSRYLDHTEAGRSIRQLARAAGCHPSTVLRQVRRIETRRDDPLVEGALHSLAMSHYAGSAAPDDCMKRLDEPLNRESNFEQDAIRILHGLCHSGAVLAVAKGMDKAIVVRSAGEVVTRNTVVDRSLAEALALRDWISCAKPSRLSRYKITMSGRSAVGSMIASAENKAQKTEFDGFLEAQAEFAPQECLDKSRPSHPRRIRYGLAESPLETLARHHDRQGRPFLTSDLVSAGERLREDFELAQIGNHLAQSRDHFEPKCEGGHALTSPALAAKKRAVMALNHLGSGLSDIALRCCCHLEGLEQAERQLGWSARSGKIVLRIALQQLKAYYSEQSRHDDMIG